MNRKKHILAIIFLNLTLLASSSIIQSEGNQSDEVIIYVMPYDFDEYSVYSANSYATAQWTSAIYASLLKRSNMNNGGWVPDLALGMPSISSNQLTFTFELKDNLAFSNGNPISIEDIEFSLRVAISPEIDIAGYSGYVDFLDNNSFTVLSDNGFSITLTQIFSFPFGILNFPIIPKKVFGDRYINCEAGVSADCTWNAEDGSDAISAGAYRVTNIDNLNEIVTLEANPYYYNAAQVRTDRLVFQKIAERSAANQALKDGSIHILDSQYVNPIEAFDNVDGIHSEMVPSPATQEMALNHFHPFYGTGESIPNSMGETNQTQILENARLLRKAMSLIMDRQTYVTEIMDDLALPAATNMPSASLGWDSSIIPDTYDLAQARELMTSLGFDYSLLGSPDAITGAYSSYFFSITILSPNTCPARNQWPADYSQQLPKLGIGVKQHVSTGWAEIIPRTFGSTVNPGVYAEGGYDVFFVGYSWALDWNPDGLYDASGSCSTGTCGNFYNFDLTETETPIADLVRQYLYELDFDTRIEIVHEIQAELAYWYPTIAILYPAYEFSWADDVQGLNGQLLGVSSQEWENVYRTGFEFNEAANVTTKNSASFIMVFSFTAFPIYVVIRSKLRIQVQKSETST